jgi:hypothetical protein
LVTLCVNCSVRKRFVLLARYSANNAVPVAVKTTITMLFQSRRDRKDAPRALGDGLGME